MEESLAGWGCPSFLPHTVWLVTTGYADDDEDSYVDPVDEDEATEELVA